MDRVQHKAVCHGQGPKRFHVWPDLNSVNKHFIMWALYTIHDYPEDKVWSLEATKIL